MKWPTSITTSMSITSLICRMIARTTHATRPSMRPPSLPDGMPLEETDTKNRFRNGTWACDVVYNSLYFPNSIIPCHAPTRLIYTLPHIIMLIIIMFITNAYPSLMLTSALPTEYSVHMYSVGIFKWLSFQGLSVFDQSYKGRVELSNWFRTTM